MLSILIIDNHLVARRGLRQILREEFRGVIFGEGSTAAQGLLLAARKDWDLIVMDTGLPGSDGLKIIQDILRICDRARILVLSAHPEQEYVAECLQLGAAGYVGKSDTRSKLVKAIHTVLAGKQYFPEVPPSGCASPAVLDPNADRRLSSREHNVMRMLAMGMRPCDIATELHVSIKTVSTYKSRILHKMHWTSTVDMVRYVDRSTSQRAITSSARFNG